VEEQPVDLPPIEKTQEEFENKLAENMMQHL